MVYSLQYGCMDPLVYTQSEGTSGGSGVVSAGVGATMIVGRVTHVITTRFERGQRPCNPSHSSHNTCKVVLSPPVSEERYPSRLL
jgi:hypothetical protein